jgi:hypothetical protein
MELQKLEKFKYFDSEFGSLAHDQVLLRVLGMRLFNGLNV